MSNERKDALQKRLDDNYTAYIESLQGKTTAELIAMAPEITAAKQVHDELLDCCDEDDVEFLLRFDDPLEVVRGCWESEITGYDHTDEMGHTLWEIRDRGLYSEEQLAKPQRSAGETPPPATKLIGQDAMAENYEHIKLFGKPALFSNYRIDRSTVPEGWYCYDVRGSDDDPGELATLEIEVVVNHAGTILSPEEIIFSKESNCLLIYDEINFLGDSATIAEFCEQHRLPAPIPAKEQLVKPRRAEGKTPSPAAQSKKSNKKERKSHER